MGKNILVSLNEFINENRLEQRETEKYKNCFTSDLIRMELIDMFFKKIEQVSSYNIEEPNKFKLIDDWDGYDDQVYIQNNLIENEFIFWEGWVNECWKAALMKDEYKNMKKEDIIEKKINQRFTKIGDEFGFIIKSYDYFKYKGKYIMKIIFSKI